MFGCRLSKLVLDRLNEIVLLPSLFHQPLAHNIDFPGGSVVKNLPAKQETWARSLGWEDPLEKEMATRSSILAWKIPWTEEPSGLQNI